MGSNGIVKETAHLHVDRRKYEDNYDRIYNSYCVVCDKKDKKSNMIKLENGTYTCKENCNED